MNKPESYYKNKRLEMLQFIPRDANRILDIGCGDGVFGSILKDELNAEVWGVEMDPGAGAKAEQVLDRVIVDHAVRALHQIGSEQFDVIVLNDVIEHVTDHEHLLEVIKTHLNINGVLIASIPNVRYLDNLVNLIFKKTWEYQDEGILDRTHVRFFTKKSLEKMFDRLGFDLVQIQGVNGYQGSWKFNIINALTLGWFSDSRHLQFAVVAKKK